MNRVTTVAALWRTLANQDQPCCTGSCPKDVKILDKPGQRCGDTGSFRDNLGFTAQVYIRKFAKSKLYRFSCSF